MADQQNGHSGTVLLAFVVGAIAGAAVALLWAPAPGAETRRKLSDAARESSEKAAEAARQGREFLRQQRESVSTAVEKGKEAFGQATGKGSKESA